MIGQVMSAIKQAIEDDSTLSAILAHVLCAQGGEFPEGCPKPVLVISPDAEITDYARMTNDLRKTIGMTLYGYTEAYAEEMGLFGSEDDDVAGVVTIGDALEMLLQHNRLNNLVRDLKVIKKTFPIPPQQWNAGLNEVRVQLECSVHVSWDPFQR